MHSSRWSVGNGDASSLVDGPVLLRCLRDSGARHPRRHSTHSDRGPRSDSITILCGGWSAIEFGEPGTGHSARCVPKQRPSKSRHCIDARSDDSPRSRPHDPTAPTLCGAGIPRLSGLDSASQRSASLSGDSARATAGEASTRSAESSSPAPTTIAQLSSVDAVQSRSASMARHMKGL